MKYINLKILNELLTNKLILSYALLSREEYPQYCKNVSVL